MTAGKLGTNMTDGWTVFASLKQNWL